MSAPVPSTAHSHEFRFRGRDLIGALVSTGVALAGLVALLQALNRLDWLPVPAPVESSDEVLMRRRFVMTRAPSRAEVVIIGDSSSAIDVEAPDLGPLLPGRPEVLNQGMFMGIGMDIYGEAAGEFIKHHPGQVRLVVLLVTAEELQNASMNALHQRLWREMMSPISAPSDSLSWQKLFALAAARDRIAGHLVPVTLHGHASLFYGYTFHLRQHLPVHGGSMVEYGWYNPAVRPAPPTVTLTDAVRREAEVLRSNIPADVKLAVGITPLPDSNASEAFRRRRDELLYELNRSLHADCLLTNLPVRLADGYFSSPFHLNPKGAGHFTKLLSRELARLPVWNRSSGK